jgi:hypothetical protein
MFTLDAIDPDGDHVHLILSVDGGNHIVTYDTRTHKVPLRRDESVKNCPQCRQIRFNANDS